MSLIGPRPLLSKYILLYSQDQRRCHEVRPGISGLIQVNGLNAISWKKKFEYDGYYVNHLIFALDNQIEFKTIRKIVIREGVNQSENGLMRPFDGKN